jgi:hypothetical protein
VRTCTRGLGRLLEERFWELLIAKSHSRAHHGVAELRDSPASGPRNLRDEPADVQSREEARDAGTLLPIGTSGAEEALAEVAVAEAVQEVFAAQDCLEQLEVRTGGGVEGALRAPVGVPNGMGEAIKGLIGAGGIVHDREGVEVPLVGGRGDDHVTGKKRDALWQGIPAEDPVAAPPRSAAHLELVRVVDDRLHPQDTPVLVVHLDPVLLHPVLDTRPGPSLLPLVEDLAREAAVELAAEKRQDIFGAQAQRGVPEQPGVEVAKSGPVLEEDVGGVLGLVGGPVVAIAREQIREALGARAGSSSHMKALSSRR